MNTPNDSIKLLLNSLYSLQNLNSNIVYSYELIKQHLVTCRKFGVALVGNPLLLLENNFIELSYLTMQHIANCNIYKDLLETVDIDYQMKNQIQGLLARSQELQNTYHQLEEKLKDSATNFMDNRPFALSSFA